MKKNLKRKINLTYPKQIINEIIKKKLSLYESFFPNTKYNFDFKKINKFKKFKTVIIIGMGGSILGTKAIYSFLKHKINKKFIFIDNLNHNYLLKLKKENNISKSLFLVISKSGNTSETIVNLSFFQSFLKKTNVIIISENKDNILRNFAKKKSFYFISHDKNIGGRYSIFSDTGMLPTYLMGIKPKNIKKTIPYLIKNKKFLSQNIKKISKINIKKTKIIIFLNYVPELNNFLYWCQQLLAESLGKKGKGFIPIISNAPKDHHSLLQLYLDGPKDKIYYVFSSTYKRKLKVNSKVFEHNAEYLNKKNFEKIKLSQKNALIRVLKDKKIPFREININKFNENTIGELFFLFIFETIFLAKILKINPYDQPAVEKVKVLTKKLLT